MPITERTFNNNILDLVESQPNTDAKESDPEEDWKNRELKEKTQNNTTAAIDYGVSEDAAEQNDGKRECKE